jgi:hypothetical protein
MNIGDVVWVVARRAGEEYRAVRGTIIGTGHPLALYCIRLETPLATLHVWGVEIRHTQAHCEALAEQMNRELVLRSLAG